MGNVCEKHRQRRVIPKMTCRCLRNVGLRYAALSSTASGRRLSSRTTRMLHPFPHPLCSSTDWNNDSTLRTVTPRRRRGIPRFRCIGRRGQSLRLLLDLRIALRGEGIKPVGFFHLVLLHRKPWIGRRWRRKPDLHQASPCGNHCLAQVNSEAHLECIGHFHLLHCAQQPGILRYRFLPVISTS